ncbi:Fungal specific transcription factor domain-containing protein [Cladophialophora immunda]|nr:Fungal specific transcription factor domain-containing protein [Cladophialophora immunda]
MCPENSLEPYHFSALSELFREAVAQGTRPSYLKDGTSDFESPRQGLNVTAVDDEALVSQDKFLAALSEAISPEDISHDKTHPQSDERSSRLNVLESDDDSRLLGGAVAKLPPYQQARFLTDIFFTYLESNWYYFDERWFRELLEQLYQEASPASQLRCTTVCLVFLVLALGGSFVHLDQSASACLVDHDTALGELPGSKFYGVAKGLIPGVLAAISVESVQCCILMGLYTLPMESATHHYTYLGLALRLAISMSLHLNKTDSQITPQARELRIRVFWTAYCLERRMSVTMGLPTMLQTRDITVPLPKRRPDLDELHPQKVDRLIAFTKLTLVLNKVTEASPVDETPEKFARVCSTLEEWKLSLPAHLVALDDTSLRVTAHLDIMYQMIWIYIGRGASLRLARQRSSQTDGVRGSDQPLNLVSQKLSERCTDAAYTIIEWIDLLKNRNRLAKFSHTDFHSCSSAIIALLLDEVLDPRRRYRSTIERGIDALRFMASGSQLAKDALQLVERLQAGVRKSDEHNESRSQRQDGSTSQDYFNHAADGLSISVNDTMEYTPSDFATLDPVIFGELEPSLLQYSDPDLSLFGFHGFYSTFETNDFM